MAGPPKVGGRAAIEPPRRLRVLRCLPFLSWLSPRVLAGGGVGNGSSLRGSVWIEGSEADQPPYGTASCTGVCGGGTDSRPRLCHSFLIWGIRTSRNATR